eukprot:TRINITY_DN5494_c0_g1_i2.p1 TRINITY_DN5494_c0_g1~~TRINITY_DN5494_c0_g1_i2.p1  ORF type:complete len:188 (-),score=40.91 TRINITY_DN5494_c0_g1_i2:123-686(-)
MAEAANHAYITCHLPLLTRETLFSRYESDAIITDVFISISLDRRRLLCRSRDSKYPAEFDFENLNRIQEGQKTPVWDTHKSKGLFSCCFGGDDDISKDELVCFSIVFLSDSIDLKAESLKHKSEWLESFREFIDRRMTKGEKAWRELSYVRERSEIESAKAQKAEQTQRVVNKYSQLKNNLKTKYGS